MKVRVENLSEIALDWAVAKCEGWEWEGTSILGPDVISHPDIEGCELLSRLSFSTSWAEGGPIIEREQIGLEIHEQGDTRASFYRMRLTFDGSCKHYHHQHGPTPLIAAMRTYVASKLGDEVEIPEELL